jgi:putative DNA primase/helicase
LWYAADSNFTMPTIDDKPTREEALQALALLESLLTGFPFVAEVDRSVALTAILTAILRGAFHVAPMTLIIAHEPGSGKTFLVNLISNMVRGQDCPVITTCKSVEEMEKRLGALLLEGAPMINLDNASDNIGGDLLCQITEQRIVRIRILGRSEAPTCEWRGCMFATGNNVALTGDMTRRGLICNINPKVERPELREFPFNPIERLLSDRGSYVAAALTITRAFIAVGCPTPDGCKPLASYGAWSKAVREPLVWLGKEDPVTSMEQARAADPVRSAARTMVALWKDHLKHNVGYSAADLIKAANNQKCVKDDNGVKEYDWELPELRELLLQQAGTPRGEIEPRKLGNWLVSLRGQVHDGYYIGLAKESATKHAKKYALVKLAGDAG